VNTDGEATDRYAWIGKGATVLHLVAESSIQKDVWGGTGDAVCTGKTVPLGYRPNLRYFKDWHRCKRCASLVEFVEPTVDGAPT
jgi:hypothetical protein